MKKIQFFNKESGDVLRDTDDWLFVMSNQVYQDNQEYWESQSGVINFWDCVEERPDIGWRVVEVG